MSLTGNRRAKAAGEVDVGSSCKRRRKLCNSFPVDPAQYAPGDYQSGHIGSSLFTQSALPATRTLHRGLAALLAGVSLGAVAAHAVDGTWSLVPADSNWNNGSNWSSSPSVPNGQATFSTDSSQMSVTFSANTAVQTIRFLNGTTTPYSFALTSTSLTITGKGIDLALAPPAPTFTQSLLGTLVFTGTASASTNPAQGNVHFGAHINNTDSALTIFQDQSTAGLAVIKNSNNPFLGGGTIFSGQSTAGSANIDNSNLGVTNFRDQSSAANSSIINDNFGTTVFQGGGQLLPGSTAGNASISNTNSGATFFAEKSSAGSANIVNNVGGITLFNDTSTASSAIITNEDATGGTEFRSHSNAGNSPFVAPAGIHNELGGVTNFRDQSSAGFAHIINGGPLQGGGFLNFFDTSTASLSVITNNGGGQTNFKDSSNGGNTEGSGATIVNNSGGQTTFSNTSSANLAFITNNGFGATSFHDTASAGSATIVNNANGQTSFHDNSSAFAATITNENGGLTTFHDTSTAQNAIIVNNSGGRTSFSDHSTLGGGTIDDRAGGQTDFFDHSTAGSGTVFTRAGGTTLFHDQSSGGTANLLVESGGTQQFLDQSTPDAPAIINATVNNSGLTLFRDQSTGGLARIINNAGGVVDMSGLTTAGMSAGSIEGAGTFLLGSKSFAVGGNNFSTEVSGVVADGGASGGAGGSLVKVGSGTLILSGPNTYTGGTTISEGTLQLGNGGASGSVLGNVVNNSVFAVNRSDTFTLGGVISGTGAFQQIGTGTTILTRNNTYSGGTSISAGTLAISADVNLGATSGGLSFDGGTLQFLATGFSSARAVTLNAGGGIFNTTGFSSTLTGIISGSGGLTKIADGTLILTGANTYSGGTTVSGGTLAISADNNIGTGPLALRAGTTLQFTNGFTFTHAVAVAGDPTIDVASGSTNTMIGVIANGTLPGDIVKTGTGTLIFTANNTYTAGTTISAGTLQLGNGGTSGSIIGNVVDNATFAVNRSDTLTFGGVISGTGAFQQNGSGTTIFTGTNTYTSGTTISAGMLQLGNGGTSGSIAGKVTDNATFAVNRSDSFTFGGVISGTGAFQQNGTGTTIFTGTNTYTGGTTISAGTLQFGNGGTSGSIIGNVTDNGTFAVSRSDIFTFGGVISGTGAFQQNGSGTTVFTGTSTYTGGTTISGGTLTLGNGGTSGSIVGNVTDNATFAVNRSDSFTFGGVISGTGAFQQNGSGTTVFTGTNTYTGGTTISGGTLTLGNGGTSGSIVGNVTDNAIFAVNRSDIFTFGGVISGTGAFQQNGPGTTIFSGTNTYTGTTTVNAGMLIVNGTIVSPVIVQPGATLGGNGTVGSSNVAGTLSPGTSIGLITIAGNLTFAGVGNYLVEVSQAAADRTNVTGTAALAGTARLAPQGGTFVIGTRYVLLNAGGGVGGTFASLAVTGTFGVNVRPDVTYDANNVFLTLDPIASLAPPGATPVPLPGLISPLLPADTPVNPRKVATALDPAFVAAGTAPGGFLALFNVSVAGLPGALSQLSGEVGTSAAVAGFQDMGQFLELMLDPFLENRVAGGTAGFGGPALAFAPDNANAGLDIVSAYARMPTKAPPVAPPAFDQRWTAWGAAYGASGSFNGNAALGSHDLTARSGGFAGGIDYRVAPNTAIGFAASGSSLSYSLSGGLGSGSGDAFKAGVYASTRFDNAYLSASAAYGAYDLTTKRTVLLPGVGDRLVADFSPYSFGARIETGYRFPWAGSSGVTPYAAFQAQSFHTPSYGEADATGLAAFALTYGVHTSDEEHGELGARFDSRLAFADNAILLLRGRLAWAHEFSGNSAIGAAFVTLPGTAFTVFGAGLPRDALLVSAGPELRLPNGWTLRAKFDGSFSGQSQTYAGTGTVRFTW